ncbi:CpsD/CapB family tyrosine-protein kinase [Pararhodobacter marinus]|uniref:CpsD/CapB family tyrosine-protein kinase n=1 Tax=Pararhodobacter marinus TaxID=2184063 RepID=UPI003512EC35
MVNTRILEERLGWRATEDGEAPTPPSRAIGHQPMLQGRVDSATRGRGRRVGPSRLNRKTEAEEAWATIPVILDDPDRLAARGHAPSIARGSAAAAAMDQLRTQILRVIDDKGLRRIGITSPSRGAGRSFVAAGLAASIARLDAMRVMLIDSDLEYPGLADLLDLDAPGPLEAVLSEQIAPEAQLRRVGDTDQGGLALALNSAPVVQAAERMMMPEAILALRAMIDCVAPDVVIHDLPPLLNDPVAPALLSQLDAVLLVADGKRSTAQDVLECERVLEGQVPLLGVVLNKSEDRDPRRTRGRH